MKACRRWALMPAALLPVLAVGCSGGAVDQERVAPDEILGVWTTSNPTYAGRSFEIQPQDLIFDTGEEGITVYPIIEVRRARGPGRVGFEIDHRGLEGGAFTFTFSFTFDPDSVTIVFRNQPEITWVLDSSSR